MHGAQPNQEPDTCEPCNASMAGKSSVDEETSPGHYPLEDVVHIEDVTRTTTVATILDVVARRLSRLGFQPMNLNMAIVKPTQLAASSVVNPGPPVPLPDDNLGLEDEVCEVL